MSKKTKKMKLAFAEFIEAMKDVSDENIAGYMTTLIQIPQFKRLRALLDVLPIPAIPPYTPPKTDWTRETLIKRIDDPAFSSLPDLKDAVLRGLELHEMRLNEIDFTGADLTGVGFQSAYMGGCNFTRAIMVNANLDGTDDVEDAIFDQTIGIYDAGKDCRNYRFIGVWWDSPEYTGWMVHAGCRWFTIKDARNHWGENSLSSNPEECLALVKKIAKAPPPDKALYNVADL